MISFIFLLGLDILYVQFDIRTYIEQNKVHVKDHEEVVLIFVLVVDPL